MSNALKCPNPSCPYLFDPSQVPASVVLTCPRCGMRFTLGSPPPPTQAAPPGYPPPQPPGLAATQFNPPGYPPAPPPGYAPPPAYPAPSYPPAPTASDPTFSETVASMEARAPAPRQRPAGRPPAPPNGGNTLLLVVVGVALMAGVGLMVYFRLNPIRTGGGGGAAPGEMPERNLIFDPPPAAWVQDDDTRTRLGPPFFLVYKRENPEAFMAFGARDYETRNPRPSELRDGLMRPLREVFEDIETPPIEGAKWLGHPATAFELRARGKKGGPTVVGECHAVGAKGFGYWSICWAGEGDSAAAFPEFDATRAKFRLLTLRDKWAPREGATKAFGGYKVSYQILDGEGMWNEPAEPKASEFDPAGNMYLRAKEKRKGRDFHHEAELLTLILDPAGDDALAQGVKYVKDMRAAEVEKTPGVKVVFTERPGPPEGDPANPIDPTAPVARFEEKVQGARALTRLRVVSAKRVENKVVVLTAWCAWEDRMIFEDRLTQIAGSLREGP